MIRSIHLLFRNKRVGLFFPTILKHHPENSGWFADSHFDPVTRFLLPWCEFEP